MPVLPGIDELLDAVINGYEDVIRRSSDLQRTLARAVPFEPVRSILNTTADLTRDIAAVQLSGARWLLDS
jgi:predicted transcriptional regulator